MSRAYAALPNAAPRRRVPPINQVPPRRCSGRGRGTESGNSRRDRNASRTRGSAAASLMAAPSASHDRRSTA